MWFETTYIKQCNTRSSADTKRLLGAIQSMRFSMALFTSSLQRTSSQISQAMEGALSGGESSLGCNVLHPDSIPKSPRSLT